MIFHCYSDPSHGWLKVQRKKVESLGIAARISSYSFQRGDWVYLEEDIDAGIFLNEFKTMNPNKTVVLRSHNSNKSSRLRNYDRYVNTTNQIDRTGNYGLVRGWDENNEEKFVKVFVGDCVGFKSDYEQGGKITKIQGNGKRASLTLSNPDGFGGDYLRYATETQEDADDCWVEG